MVFPLNGKRMLASDLAAVLGSSSRPLPRDRFSKISSGDMA